MGNERLVYPYIIARNWKDFRLKYNIEELKYLWENHNIYAEEEINGCIYFFLHLDLGEVQKDYHLSIDIIEKKLQEMRKNE